MTVRAASQPPPDDPGHLRGCEGHIVCPRCKAETCAQIRVIDFSWNVRRVVCLECLTGFPSRSVIR